LLASAHWEANEVALKVTLLEGELVDVRQACDLAMVKLQGLSDMAADADRRWEDVKGQCKILAQKLTLLQTKVSELCQAIVGPQRPPPSEEMQVATAHHTEMARKVGRLHAAVSSTMQSVLKHSPTEAF
jgi:chromosome segregation ATPase